MVLTTISACGVGCGRFQLKLRLIFRFCRRPLCSVRAPTGVQKTLSGLIKLVSPNPEIPVPDEVLEWAMRIALGCRRRVKEQQKRTGSAEFRNTQLSYAMGDDGVEKFVPTPELYSESSIGSDSLPPGQAWVPDGPSGSCLRRSPLQAGITRSS